MRIHLIVALVATAMPLLGLTPLQAADVGLELVTSELSHGQHVQFRLTGLSTSERQIALHCDYFKQSRASIAIDQSGHFEAGPVRAPGLYFVTAMIGEQAYTHASIVVQTRDGRYRIENAQTHGLQWTALPDEVRNRWDADGEESLFRMLGRVVERDRVQRVFTRNKDQYMREGIFTASQAFSASLLICAPSAVTGAGYGICIVADTTLATVAPLIARFLDDLAADALTTGDIAEADKRLIAQLANSIRVGGSLRRLRPGRLPCGPIVSAAGELARIKVDDAGTEMLITVLERPVAALTLICNAPSRAR